MALYVDVAVDAPVDSLLTYSVPAKILPDVRLGLLVEVPVGKRRRPAAVIQIRRTIKKELREKVRPVTRILSAGMVVTKASLDLAGNMAAASGHPVGLCLFRLLPPLSKKPPSPQLAPVRNPLSAAPQRLHLILPAAQRIPQYALLAERAVQAGRQVLLIAPQSMHPLLTEKLTAKNVSVTRVTAEMRPGTQRKLAAAFQSGHVPLLLGTRHIVGWAAHNLGLLIVEDVLDRGHQDDQQPYLDSATIAALRAFRDQAALIYGASIPTLGMRLDEQQSRAQRVAAQALTPALTVTRASHGRLPPHLLSALQHSRRAAVVCPRHGIGGSLICRGCNAAITCESCQGQLELTRHSTDATCYECRRKQSLPVRCLRCGSHDLLFTGIGTESVEDSLKRQLGPLPPTIQVGTEQLLHDKTWELVLFMSADSPLTTPSLERPLEYLSRIQDAASFAHQTFVLSSATDHPLWSLLGTTRDQTLDSLLLRRQQAGLPPYSEPVAIWATAEQRRGLRQLVSQRFGSEDVPSFIEHHDMMTLLVSKHHRTEVFHCLKSVRNLKFRAGSILTTQAFHELTMYRPYAHRLPHRNLQPH